MFGKGKSDALGTALRSLLQEFVVATTLIAAFVSMVVAVAICLVIR